MSTVLKMEHIEKVYGNQVRALHDISLEVSAGEFVAVIGPSGSGKSTLLRTVNQLVVPSGGHVYIDGEEVTGASGKKLRLLRRKVGMIFQHYNLVQRLSVMQNVLHGRLGYMSALDGMLGNYTEEDKRKAIDLLQEIEMGDRLYNRASDLSGGQKQRMAIARAIIKKPEILIFDDSTSALDLSTEAKLHKALRENLSGVTVIMIAQRIASVMRADKIAVLENGSICAFGTHKELMESSSVYRDIYYSQMKQGEEEAVNG